MQEVTFKEAIHSKRNRFSQWDHARDRLVPEVWPELRPSFQVSRGGKVFTIGSCFARNIEEHLDRLGFDIPTLALDVPKTEWEGRGNGILNKYTPAAIWQEVNWAARIYERDRSMTENDCAAFAFPTEETIIDTNLGGYVPVSKARFYERRRQIYKIFENAFSADCVTLTLGLIEAWFDLEQEIYVQRVPVAKHFRRVRDRFAFRILSYENCLKFMQDTIDIIRRLNPAVKFLITTSPVPLARTFTEDDVITANMQSKCLLRAVCGQIVASNEGVDYFPSFESVILTKSYDIWASDKLHHVSDAFVGKIVSHLVNAYFPDAVKFRSLYQQAYSEQAAGKHESALALANEAREAEPNSAEIWSLIARSSAALERIDDAIDAIRRTIELDPDESRYKAFLAERLHENDQLDEALKAMAGAVELGPAIAENRAYFSELLALAGDHQRSLDEARQAVSLNPRKWRFHVGLGRALMANGLAEEARESCRSGRALAGKNPYALRGVAKLMLELGDLSEGRECLELSQEYSPNRKFKKSVSRLLRKFEEVEQSA